MTEDLIRRLMRSSGYSDDDIDETLDEYADAEFRRMREDEVADEQMRRDGRPD